MLGAFHEARAGGLRFAVRHLAGARPVAWPGKPLPREPLRDFDRFVAWVAGRVRGSQSQADYEVPAVPGLGTITGEFTLEEDPDGFNLRWFAFDNGGIAEWFAHEAGQQGVAGGGFAELVTALYAWVDNPGTIIFYNYSGTTTDTSGLTSYDTVNTILFNDPNGEVSPFACGSGGVLAIGGPWYETATTSYQGTPYHRIVNADVVVNDGISCFFDASPNASKAAAEIFGHELGHTMGFGHSAVPDALMAPAVHNDGRGAVLRPDDRAAAAALYKNMFPRQVFPMDFFTIPPCRLIDTRNPNGPYGGPALQAGQPRVFSAANHCGIPFDAYAIAVNITVVSPTGNGYLRLFPPTEAEPNTSNINFSSGQTRANNAILPLSLNLAETFAVLPGMAEGTVNVVIDVSGYFWIVQ